MLVRIALGLGTVALSMTAGAVLGYMKAEEDFGPVGPVTEGRTVHTKHTNTPTPVLRWKVAWSADALNRVTGWKTELDIGSSLPKELQAQAHVIISKVMTCLMAARQGHDMERSKVWFEEMMEDLTPWFVRILSDEDFLLREQQKARAAA